jgi:hypothetical protein
MQLPGGVFVAALTAVFASRPLSRACSVHVGLLRARGHVRGQRWLLLVRGFASERASCVPLLILKLQQYPTGMNNDPGNTFGMFADFGIAGMFVVFGVLSLIKHAKYDADNTPIGKPK